MNTPPITAIRLSLRELAQLFNSLDPSPFVERDLDADAEEYITSWAREVPPGRELELAITLAEPAADTGVEKAVRRYFSTRAAIKRLEFGQLMRRGRLSLGVGLLFLVLCLLLGSSSPNPVRLGERHHPRRTHHRRLGGDVAALGDLSLRLVAAF